MVSRRGRDRLGRERVHGEWADTGILRNAMDGFAQLPTAFGRKSRRERRRGVWVLPPSELGFLCVQMRPPCGCRVNGNLGPPPYPLVGLTRARRWQVLEDAITLGNFTRPLCG